MRTSSVHYKSALIGVALTVPKMSRTHKKCVQITSLAALLREESAIYAYCGGPRHYPLRDGANAADCLINTGHKADRDSLGLWLRRRTS